MEVMWFHTGNHTEMMQEVTINVASEQLLPVIPAAYPGKTFRQI